MGIRHPRNVPPTHRGAFAVVTPRNILINHALIADALLHHRFAKFVKQGHTIRPHNRHFLHVSVQLDPDNTATGHERVLCRVLDLAIQAVVINQRRDDALVNVRDELGLLVVAVVARAYFGAWRRVVDRRDNRFHVAMQNVEVRHTRVFRLVIAQIRGLCLLGGFYPVLFLLFRLADALHPLPANFVQIVLCVGRVFFNHSLALR